VLGNEFDKMRLPVFSPMHELEKIVEVLPRDSKAILKELIAVHKENNLLKTSEFLEARSSEMFAPKLDLNKKTEKGFIRLHKYYTEEKVKTEENHQILAAIGLSNLALAQGCFFWPFESAARVQPALDTFLDVLRTLKDGLGPETMKVVEELHSLASKANVNGVEAGQIKEHLKFINKLI
jgi:hypothetical protein